MKISVVITTYNRPHFLKEALVGVSQQTLAPCEVIIIDDCSTEPYDEIFPIIESIQAKYLKQKSGIGANAARNIGISEATGDVIAFLDDDDVWLPFYLETIHREFSNGADAVVSGFKQLGKEEVVVTNKDLRVSKTSLLRGNTYCGMSGFSAKRQVLLNNFFDESLNNGQDWDLYVRLFQQGVKFINIPRALFLYRFQNEDGIGAKVRKMKPSEINKRLGSAYKHKSFLGDYWFKKRVCEQILFSLKHKNEKSRWIIQALKMAGFKATFVFFYNALKRKILNKPMSI
ncbi:glycosyltransferase family 2 protein [Alteromonas sp. PRIM-21]|uniref:glycosyltransferase family 2 protein n=1 Tax=Alteromonas sp. PRIM-21 TaxID=1454978 RepID=UPI0022B9565D|nr:glycosyltransferase family A protein [Alteromonas sp. PRIM-21]MCZ8528423.1 glycosyltransferase family 2 protein [Alteromonas sp. PRIM-21]